MLVWRILYWNRFTLLRNRMTVVSRKKKLTHTDSNRFRLSCSRFCGEKKKKKNQKILIKKEQLAGMLQVRMRGGGGGLLGGTNTPPSPPFGSRFCFYFYLLLIRQVGHVRGYPYSVSGKLIQLLLRKEKKKCRNIPLTMGPRFKQTHSLHFLAPNGFLDSTD